MKKYSLLLSALLVSLWMSAQQGPMYGQYIFNKTVINPAHAGADAINQFGILYRHQWVGIEGAPRTSSMFFTTRLPKNMGMAAAIYNDVIGPINDMTLSLDFAGHIQLSERWNASLGLRLNTRMLSANLSELQLDQSGDPNFDAVNTDFLFNIGAGVLIYSPKAFVGGSIPVLLNQSLELNNQPYISFERQLFVYGGYNWTLSEHLKFQPSFLVKAALDAPIQLDLNAIWQYNSKFDFGAMLRSIDAVGVALGMNITENWYFGYMYEYPLNELRRITNQTHEISLRYRWESTLRARIHSPRYFL